MPWRLADLSRHMMQYGLFGQLVVTATYSDFRMILLSISDNRGLFQLLHISLLVSLLGISRHRIWWSVSWINSVCLLLNRIGNSNPVDTICITVEDYCQDFVHLHDQFYDALLQRAQMRVAREYFRALFTAKLVVLSFRICVVWSRIRNWIVLKCRISRVDWPRDVECTLKARRVQTDWSCNDVISRRSSDARCC